MADGPKKKVADEELVAINAIIKHLAPLSEEAVKRVLAYVNGRFDSCSPDNG